MLTFPSQCLSRSNFQLYHDSLSLHCFARFEPLYPLPVPSCKQFFTCICRSKISNFIFFVFSPQNVEVFYWCGEKQWAQGRALWWQKCIFNPCEWMAPHIPQQQALYWMAALTRLFSLLITALCLFTMDIVIYLHQLSSGGCSAAQALSGEICLGNITELDMRQSFVSFSGWILSNSVDIKAANQHCLITLRLYPWAYGWTATLCSKFTQRGSGWNTN